MLIKNLNQKKIALKLWQISSKVHLINLQVKN